MLEVLTHQPLGECGGTPHRKFEILSTQRYILKSSEAV